MRARLQRGGTEPSVTPLSLARVSSFSLAQSGQTPLHSASNPNLCDAPLTATATAMGYVAIAEMLIAELPRIAEMPFAMRDARGHDGVQRLREPAPEQRPHRRVDVRVAHHRVEHGRPDNLQAQQPALLDLDPALGDDVVVGAQLVERLAEGLAAHRPLDHQLQRSRQCANDLRSIDHLARVNPD